MSTGRSELARLINGFRVTAALNVVATLGIADLLADGPRSSADLAAVTGTDADALERLLRALATVDVVEERESGVFTLTDVGDALRADAPGSLRAQTIFLGRPHQWNVWPDLVHSIRTGESAFEHQHGESAWDYRSARPEESAIFDAWMTTQTQTVDAALVDGYDFARFAHLVDVGGGHGALLRAILDANPESEGTLFDQPHVVADALEHPRMRVVGGSFFESIPTGGDAYLLKSIIHDWPDDDAVTILRTCARALDADARVLLLERDVSDPATTWMDLQMLVMFGSRERSADEYAALFTAAGLEPAGATPVAAGFAVFEAKRG